MVITLKELIDIIFEEDTGNSFATGLYNDCFKNNELITTKTCNDFINDRINKYLKFKSSNTEKFNYDNFESFYNEVINWFKINHPELLKGNKTTSFISTIKNTSLNYYNKINQVN